jgi:hypothetical protein
MSIVRAVAFGGAWIVACIYARGYVVDGIAGALPAACVAFAAALFILWAGNDDDA